MAILALAQPGTEAIVESVRGLEAAGASSDAPARQRDAVPLPLDRCDEPAVAASWAGRPAGEVIARVRACIADHFGIPQGKVLPSLHLTSDLEADELDRLEIAMILEEQFGIEIPDGDIEKWQTASDILASVQARLQQSRPGQPDSVTPLRTP